MTPPRKCISLIPDKVIDKLSIVSPPKSLVTLCATQAWVFRSESPKLSLVPELRLRNCRDILILGVLVNPAPRIQLHYHHRCLYNWHDTPAESSASALTVAVEIFGRKPWHRSLGTYRGFRGFFSVPRKGEVLPKCSKACLPSCPSIP
jgi:hypothetical protein